MSSITQVSEGIQTILKSRAKELERQTGFVERTSAQLDGPAFAQTTVWTWMQTAEASYTQLRHTAASVGVHVSNQAIEQRFGEGSARLLRALREEAVAEVISRGSQATTRGSQWTHHASAQRLSSSTAGQRQTQAPTPG